MYMRKKNVLLLSTDAAYGLQKVNICLNNRFGCISIFQITCLQKFRKSLKKNCNSQLLNMVNSLNIFFLKVLELEHVTCKFNIKK